MYPMQTENYQAASDDVPVITAILSGLRSRHYKTGDVPIFIHTVRSRRFSSNFYRS